MEAINKHSEAELKAVLQARTAALLQGDANFFRQLLADDFSYTNASGVLLDKASYLEFYIESGLVRWQAQDLEEVSIRFYGDTTVLTCLIHDRAIFEEKVFDAYFRSTQVFVKQANQWRYVAGHTTTIATEE